MKPRTTKPKATEGMFILKRNQIIITALVIMIAVAGYLSWLDSRPGEEQPIGFQFDGLGEIGALVMPSGELVIFPEDYPSYGLYGSPWVNGHNPVISMNEDVDAWPTLADIGQVIPLPVNEDITEAGEAIFVDVRNDSPFFVQARLNREQARSHERAILNDLINNHNLGDEHRTIAVDAMLEMQRRIEREAAAESLIESKGFSEVYVRIADNSVDVIVNQESLSNSELAIILDVIMRKTGMQANQIHISPMRR